MEEEKWKSVLKGSCVWVTRTLSTRVCIKYHKGGKWPSWSGSKEHNKSGAAEEENTTLCVGCEGSERNGTRPLGSPCCTV